MAKNKVDDFLYEEESYKIRGACFQVYNVLGGGIKEKIIERALAKELQAQGLMVGHQVRVEMSYHGDMNSVK